MTKHWRLKNPLGVPYPDDYPLLHPRDVVAADLACDRCSAPRYRNRPPRRWPSEMTTGDHAGQPPQTVARSQP